MLLKKIYIESFAGIPQRTTEFKKGLNVVLGPNETGKSTMVRALHLLLFQATSLSSGKMKMLCERFLPISGGDYFKLGLEFENKNQNYKLMKTWGNNAHSVLVFPNQIKYTNASEIEILLKELMDLNAASYKKILIAYQNQLSQTIEQFKNSEESMDSIAQILRDAVLVQDGISADQLQVEIENIIDNYYSNWDIKLNYPKNNRGIHNPYKNSNGKIIEAYYAYRELELKLDSTLKYEKKIDEFSAEMNILNTKINANKIFLESHKKTFDENHEKAIFEKEKEKIELELKPLNEKLLLLPKLEIALKNLKAKITSLENDLKNLKKELEIAEQKHQNKNLLEKYNQAKNIQNELKKAEKAYNSTIKIELSDLELMEKIENKIQRIGLRLEASKLKIELSAKKNFEAQINQEEKIKLQKNETLKKEVAGKFAFSHPDFDLKVYASDLDLNELENDLESNKKQQKELFEKFKVKNLNELKQIYLEKENIIKYTNELKSNLKFVLQNQVLEDLEKTVQENEKLPSVREIDLLRNLNQKMATDLAVFKSEIENKSHQQKQILEEHESEEKLQNLILDKKLRLKELKAIFDQFNPLPSGFETAKDFVEKYEKIKIENSNCIQNLHEIQLERKEHEKNEPETSSEDLEIQLDWAKKNFKQKQTEAAAYLKIQNKLNGILAGLNQQTFDPLYQKAKKYLNILTNEKYKDLEMDKTIPLALKKEDKSLKISLLSKGTLDVLALAFRLSLADYFLKNAEGFFILDDPLTDLDPKRQAKAIECIQDFAKEKQVILFTCHPNHATQLGGNLVKL